MHFFYRNHRVEDTKTLSQPNPDMSDNVFQFDKSVNLATKSFEFCDKT